ncbi:unnamed protein product [Microthlaspi erraticum]|uniref:TF-B3 domain-containing protein n=1 Tax=Microthlaspi erraticum TaxID=1685480 RepID=A0A6D2KCY6_9BRAS|nr:unnamed protein product [Microthlaspi erraticum]
MEGSSGSGSGSETKVGVEDWEAFCELLSNSQPQNSAEVANSDDFVEFLRRLPSNRIEAVVGDLTAAEEILGSVKENPLGSQIVRSFFDEYLKEKNSEQKYGKTRLSHNSVPREFISEFTGQHPVYKEFLFKICLTTADEAYLVIDNDLEKYFPSYFSSSAAGDTEYVFQAEDEKGKQWKFIYSYLNTRQSYALTKGWSKYVQEKQLCAGDLVFFQRHVINRRRFFIDYNSTRDVFALTESLPSTVLPSTKLRLPKINPILVVSCGDDQESEETYFISYILNELRLRGFTPCRYELSRTTVTANPGMLRRSSVCIMIISMNNARSPECLDVFLAMMDSLKANKVALIPVFFKVSGDSSKRARLGNQVQASQAQKWREAMVKLTVFNRYEYMKGDEVMLAKSIVRDVCCLRNFKTRMNLVGIRPLLQSILPLLDCPQTSAPRIVGIWGMAGIGKTTITREIYRTQAERYDVCYFLPDFHLMCQAKGLSHLRHEFYWKIFGEEKVFIDACDTKPSFTRDMLLDKSVLVIIDGVSNARDAEVLLGGFGWLSGGHTIILTSRNRQVLIQCKANELYEIPKLSVSDSSRLCSMNATGASGKGKKALISDLVYYASGIPLAMRVLGSSVQKKYINNEKEHLRRLRQHPPIEIYDAFGRSFNGLDENEKNIFLDLACFFRGEKKYHVVNMLDGCGLFTDLGIYALIDESLISLVDNRIEMPNIFQDIGRFVVCQENNEAGKRSRLWDPSDIVNVLTNNSGTEAIEGIFLDASGLTFELNPNVFEKMYRLRFLKLHCPTSENHCKVCLPQGLHSLPDELRLLHWERYPLGSLPRNFNPKNLVELNMPYSNLTKLWKGTKNLEKLKRIILSHSRQLTKFPRLSKAMSLEHIDLEGCTSLVKINSSILHHHKLTFLSLKDCSHLRIMPTMAHLESLEVLNLSGCSELENLQDFSPNLKELYLAGTAITEIPSSIKDLTRLVTLDLEDCKRLQHLPPGISNFKAMMTLKLSGCSYLKSLPSLDAAAATSDTTLSVKLLSSSMDQGEIPSVEHMAPPYKRCRLKVVIETVILSLRKRKREKSVFTVQNRAKVHLGSVSSRLELDQNYRNLEHNEGKELGAPSSTLSDSLTSIRKPSQAAAQFHQVSKARSLEKKRTYEFGDKEFGVSVVSPKTRKPRRSYSDGSIKPSQSCNDDFIHDAAAIRIQTDFRGYKCRKQHLITKQGILLIQARWRGYQVRKIYRNLKGRIFD